MVQLNRPLPRLWPLVTLLALALFPFGWLAESWPAFAALLGTTFSSVRVHAIGHATIFAVVGLALLATFPGLRSRPWHYLGLILLAGAAQEAFQLAYKARPIVFDDARDIVTDLIGALAVYLVVVLIRRWRRR